MLHEITLGDKTIVAIGLPEDAKNILYYMGYLQYEIDEPILKNWATDKEICNPAACLDYLVRTEGKPMYKNNRHVVKIDIECKLIGIYPDMSDEQLIHLVEPDKIYENAFMCYTETDTTFFYTSKESFESLMKREKLYTVNPYGDTPFPYHHPEDYPRPDFKIDWQEAEARTFKKFAILLKLN